MTDLTVKTCRDCQGSFPSDLEHFHKMRQGLASYCKECASARAKAHYQANRVHGIAVRAAYREKHQDEINAHIRHYYQAHPDLKRESDRRWYQENTERSRQSSHARYVANKAACIARARDWATNHPEETHRRTVIKSHRRRGLLVDAMTRAYIAVLSRDPCSYCSEPSDAIEIDHVVPVSSGGSGNWENLTAACPRCNRAKSNKSLLSFLLGRICA